MARYMFVALIACIACAHALRPDLQEIVDQIHAKRNDPESRAYVNLDGKDYYFATDVTLMWVDAVEICNALFPVDDNGFTLLSLETDEERTLINNYLMDNEIGNIEYWFSYQQIEDFVNIWTGSGQINKLAPDWLMGEPNEVSGKICFFMKRMGWGDDPCNSQKAFICEGH